MMLARKFAAVMSLLGALFTAGTASAQTLISGVWNPYRGH